MACGLQLYPTMSADHVFDTRGHPKVRVLLDRGSFVVFLGGHVTRNVAFPCLAAS
jgi:hypothetical protein